MSIYWDITTYAARIILILLLRYGLYVL
ncbi:hypothetical protein BDI4_830021 [Burkholderia diffusa]|nr:hypothetical protein BDI4_830021 [Burkholderia diffusa]